MQLRPVALLVAAVLATTLAGCSDSGSQPAGHAHGSGAAMVSLPVGDGTKATDVGYSLEDAAIDTRPGRTGEVRFRITDAEGEPVTAYLEELTKEMHLYVVREDLAVFRHLHPTMADDGTWTASVTLPSGGDYRVITEFVAEDAGGNGDHLVLGDTVPVEGPVGEPTGEDDPFLSVEVVQAPPRGPAGRMRLVVRDAQDRPVRLGTYLGTFAHVTGFQRDTGAVVHLHPLTDPAVTEDGSAMTFHTEIEQAGPYRLFVQVRVDGYLHTVPVETTVA